MLNLILLMLNLSHADADCDGIEMSAQLCDPGDVVEATVCLEPIEAETYEWRSDELEFDEVDGATASFTCPHVTCPEKDSFAIYVIAMDADGHQMWAFEDIEVQCVVPEEMNTTGWGGCGGAGTAALVPLALLAGGLGRRRHGRCPVPGVRV